jgi:hypothetical protein
VKTPAKSWDEIVDIRDISDARVQIVVAAGFLEAEFIHVMHDSRWDTPERPLRSS